jgi:hypothetical protein
MSEEQPKKRGRPSKADIAARTQSHVVNGDTSRQPEDVMAALPNPAFVPQYVKDMDNEVIDKAMADRERAQAYALRVWGGQSASLPRAERFKRVMAALNGQNLPTDSVRLPGSNDEEAWDDGDDEPVSWRMKLPKPDGIV